MCSHWPSCHPQDSGCAGRSCKCVHPSLLVTSTTTSFLAQDHFRTCLNPSFSPLLLSPPPSPPPAPPGPSLGAATSISPYGPFTWRGVFPAEELGYGDMDAAADGDSGEGYLVRGEGYLVRGEGEGRGCLGEGVGSKAGVGEGQQQLHDLGRGR
jgi:hypothetical protein